MKNLYARLTQALVDAPVTYRTGITGNNSHDADASTGYSVSKNQNNNKSRPLPMLASLMLLLLFTSGIYRLNAQTPVVTNPWANLNSGPIVAGPLSIKVDANGNIYTANYNISTISKVTPSGVVTPSWATLAPFAQPYDISFDANGNLYSVNYNHNTVSKVTPAGVITQAWATLAAGAQPYAVVTDAYGNVYTANYGNSTVSKITPTGVVTHAWATYPANSRPAGIIIDNNGNVYTANTASSTVSKITPTGVVTHAWATLDPLAAPQRLVLDNNGNIYTTNAANNTVSKITSAGVVTHAWATLAQNTTVFPPNGANPIGIAFDAVSGSIFTANAINYTISKIGVANGSTIQNWVTGLNAPSSLITSQGNLYVANGYGGTITKVVLPGAFDITFNQTSPTCSNSSNGGLRAIPSGTCGTGYQFLWTPGGFTTDTINNLAPGTYSVRVACGTDTVNKSVTLTASTVVAAPSTSNQTLCNGVTVADLVATPASGNTIVWYASATGGTALPNSTTLVNGTKYFAAQVTSSNCESSVRVADSVTIVGSVQQTNDTAFCKSNTAAINFIGASGNTYNWTATQNGSGIPASGTGNISFTAGNNTNAVIKDTVMVAAGYTSPYSYTISDGTYTFADTTGSAYLNLSTEYSTGNLSSAKPIGFNFNFFGTNYSDIYISNLGSVSFDAAATKLIYGQLRGTWKKDANSKIAYITTGTAPNRKLIVSFIDFTKPDDITITPPFGPPITTTYTADPVAGRGTFQIVLNETVNTIESLKQSVPSLTAFTIPMGMGPSGTINGNYEGVKNGTNQFYVAGRNNGDWLKLNNESKIFTPIAGFNCTGNKDTFFITVNPVPKADSIPDQQVCPGGTASAVNFTTPVTGGTVGYKWTNSNTAIGLAASGNGNVPSFTAASTGQTSTITVTPYMLKSATDTCFGTVRTFTITADLPPAPTTTGSLVVYTGIKTISQLDVTPLAGGAVNYYYTATDGTALPVTTAVVDDTTYYVSQTVNGCESNPRKQIKVNRIANDSIVLCNPATVANLVTTPNAGNAVKWYSSATAIDTLAYNTDINTGTNTLYVAEFSTVASNRVPVTVIVNPIPNVLPTADTIVCNVSTIPAINFATTTSGTVTYNWTNNNTSIGLAASGTGNIASFVATNLSTTSATTATIIVTPTITNAGISCEGVKDTFLITVNPTIGVRVIPNQVVCNGSPTTAVSYSGPRRAAVVTAAVVTIVYNWTNNTPSIGLAASGTGVIPSFTAVNNGNAPVIATIVVTPTYTNNGVSCIGTPRTFTITVNPTATIDTVANQVVCNGANTTAINFSSPTTGGTIVYDWTNNNTNIGLATSGTGNIASFAATNSGTTPDTATITVTPFYTNAGVICTGIVQTFTITVNPTATVDTIFSEVVCNGTSVASVTPTSPTTGGTVTYVWTNTNTAIGLTASGAGNVTGFTATNTSAAPITATITITPIFTNAGISCTGTPQTYTVTVNPTATVNTVNNQIVCNGSAVTAVNFSTTATGGTVTYAWTNSNTAIGLSASGSGNIASFTATNNGTAPAIATITVTPTFTNAGVSCQGTAQTFTITVNPTATVNAISNQTVCNGSSIAAINFGTTATGGTVTYNWTNNNTSFGLAASGTGNIASFNAVNNSNAPQTATITVTPVFSNGSVNCTGTSTSFTITVNPEVSVNTIASQVLCNNSTTAAVNFTSPATGGSIVYNWTNSNTAIGLPAGGSGNIASFTAINNTNSPLIATISVIATYSNAGISCSSQPQTFVYIVNPTATINAISNQTLCNRSAVTAINFASATTGGTIVYNWTNNTTSIGLAANGSGNIASFNAINTGFTIVTATITVTPTFTNGSVSCTGTPQNFTITVNPTAVVNSVNDQTICADITNNSVNFSSPVAGTIYSWTNSNPSIGLAASGTGTVPSFTAVNTSPNATSATITVTPNTAAGCIGQSISYNITVNGKSVSPISISNPTPIVCANNAFTTLTVDGGALGTGANWKWYADSLNTVSIGSGPQLANIAVAKTTTYFVRAEGTCNNTAAASIVVQRANLVHQVRQHWSDVLLFDNSSNNYVAWQWYKNGVAVAGATLQQYSESTSLAGIYYVVATDKNGVQFISCPLTIAAGSFTGLKISLFPNPADKGATVTLSTSFTANELLGASLTITDVFGRVIRQIVQVTPNTAIQAPTATGMYIATLTLQNGMKYSANLLTK